MIEEAVGCTARSAICWAGVGLQELGWARAIVGALCEGPHSLQRSYHYTETPESGRRSLDQSLRARIEFFASEFAASADLAQDMLALAGRTAALSRNCTRISTSGALLAAGQLEESEESWRSAYLIAEDRAAAKT